MTKAAAVARKRVPIFLVAAFALAAPAQAQKSGGSITVGQELEIAGFDPLKSASTTPPPSPRPPQSSTR